MPKDRKDFKHFLTVFSRFFLSLILKLSLLRIVHTRIIHKAETTYQDNILEVINFNYGCSDAEYIKLDINKIVAFKSQPESILFFYLMYPELSVKYD